MTRKITRRNPSPKKLMKESGLMCMGRAGTATEMKVPLE